MARFDEYIMSDQTPQDLCKEIDDLKKKLKLDEEIIIGEQQEINKLKDKIKTLSNQR